MYPELSLVLPYPPSVNTYWGFRGSRRFLTARAREFKALVADEFRRSAHNGFAEARLAVKVGLCPPDKRVRDIDNIAKPLLDALCQAGVFIDDGQIDLLVIERMPVIAGGCCKISIASRGYVI